jgi:subtilisin-like proprotein convertase family protein
VLTGMTAGVGNVALTGVNGDVSLYVYSGADFTTGLLCQSTAVGNTAGEMCSFTVPAGGTVYIKVVAAGGTTGAVFSINANVTLTWNSADVPKSVPAYTNVNSIINVAGGPTTITKVTVKFSFTHTWVGDLAFYLKSPTGTEIDLSSYNGSSGDNYTNTVFDDAATTSITLGSAPFTGTYRPEVPLSTFNGQNANGTWTLRCYDSYGWTLGSLTAWSITVN